MTDFRALSSRLLAALKTWSPAGGGPLEGAEEQYEAALIAEADAALAQPEPQGLMPEVDDILRLAAIIRRVDGNHDKGAAALAEAILSHPDSRWQHAQPEPQGPTEEELLFAFYEASLSEGGDTDEVTLRGLRAVLARWGRPAIEPVPVSERLPGPEDCDEKGRCWWFSPPACGPNTIRPCWTFDSETLEGDTHWLPHWALPVPGVEAANG